jgi:hypothetical protein
MWRLPFGSFCDLARLPFRTMQFVQELVAASMKKSFLSGAKF